MFGSSYRSSSPFPLMDLDMWDTKSCFSAQSSAWCGMAAVSGSGFLSSVGNSGSFGQNDPGLRRWQSSSHLAAEHTAAAAAAAAAAGRPFAPPGAELRAARGESSYRQAEVMQWLQDSHDRVDAQLDRLKTRDRELSYNMSSSQLLDMKHKLEATRTLQQQKEAATFPRFEKSQQHGEPREKVLKLEKELFQMRSGLRGSSNSQPMEAAHGVHRKTLPVSPESSNNQEKQKVEPEIYKLREALREAEAKLKIQEEERNKALQHLQTATETQRTLLNQIEEMRRSHAVQNHSEVQEQLSEANNKFSQACLEKAVLSTEVLKLEDNVKELKAKQSEALSDKDRLIQEKADLQQRIQVLEEQLEKTQHQSEEHLKQSQDIKIHNEAEIGKLREELKKIRQSLETAQCQLQELKDEKTLQREQITDLQAERSQLIREKEELLQKINQAGNEAISELQEKCCQHRESVGVLEAENQTLRDQYSRLQAEAAEREKMLHLLEEDHEKQDSQRVQTIEELRAMTSHWTEKWQKVALTLQATQEELNKVKKSNSRNEKDSDSLLRIEFDACKQALELERSRSQALLLGYKPKGGDAVQAEDKRTQTDLSESSLSWEPPSNQESRQNKSPQVSQDSPDAVNQQTDVSTANSLRIQLDESRRKVDQLQQEKTQAVQKLQSLRQLFLVKEEKASAEERRDKTVCPVNLEAEQQRRLVTEQLKSLFKEREEKEAGKADKTTTATAAAAAAGASSPQDWTPAPKTVRAAVDRRNWQLGSGLMPVFEEDEENEDWSEEEEEDEEEEEEEEEEENEAGGAAEVTNAESSLLHQRQLMSALTAASSSLKAENQSPQQGLSLEQPIHTPHCLDECDLQLKSPPSLYPDGIFKAELVNICVSSEDEEEGEVK